MKTVCELNKCNGCMACVDRCPKQCISVKDDVSCFNAIIAESLCINCKLCEKTCPNVTKVEKTNPIEWKQGWAAEAIRYKASSGGAASSIIKGFIKNGGYVASCLFKDGDFVFDITKDTEVAKKFVGSKYVKSNPTGIYKKVEERLKTDKVLFIGLPCQVAALKNFIKKQDNLYTVDLICHGTPSSMILAKYLAENDNDINQLQDIKFRSSNDFGLIIDGSKVCNEGQDDYLMTFLSANNYTENCYECQFATKDRVSDITLGDSWGTEFSDEEKNGVSLLLVQSEKGKEVIEGIDFNFFDVDIDNAVEQNHQLRHPSIRTPERDKFLSLVKNGKSISYATFCIFKKRIIKRNIKKVLTKLHLMEVQH